MARKGKGRFDDAPPSWNVVGDSKHAVGTINRPDGGGGRGEGKDGGGRFDLEDLVKVTPYAMPKPAEPEPGYTDTGKPKKLTVPDLFPKGDPYREKRDEAVAKGEPKTSVELGKPKTRRTYELSWEEYNKLSDDQRKAVDFNTLLIQAREKDLNTEYTEGVLGDVAPEQRKQYDQAVEEMFGKDGGSETYAPETVAVLKQIDFQGSEGDDLDNFLGLKSAISANELKNFSVDPVKASVRLPASLPGLPTKLEATGYDTKDQLAQGVANLQQKLAEGRTLMSNFRKSAAVDRNQYTQRYGGRTAEVKEQLGWGGGSGNPDDPNIHDVFRWAYENLAQKGGDADSTWGYLNEKLRPNELQSFMRFIDERSSQAQQYGLTLGDVQGASYKTPEQFRKLLGLVEGD